MSDKSDTAFDLDLDIFTALTNNHDYQRKLCQQLQSADELSEKQQVFATLKLELQAHAAAEERHFYVPVMQYDEGLEIARHAITEHHQMDELIETLDDGRTSADNWHEACETLIDKVLHHLEEEEQDFFVEAKKILDKELQQRLGSLYQVEHRDFEQTHGE